MADFNLLVGAKPDASWENFQKDITSMINDLEKNIPAIKVKLEVNQASIDNVRAQIESIQGNINGSQVISTSIDTGNITEGMNAATTKAKAAGEAVNNVTSKINSAGSATETLKSNTEKYAALLTKVNKLIGTTEHNRGIWTAAQNGKSSAHYQGLGTELTRLRELSLLMSEKNIPLEEAEERYNNINKSLAGHSAYIKSVGEDTKTWSHRIGGLAEKFSTWFSITRVIMAVVRAIKQMYNAVVEIDTAMTELRKVTDETNATYDKFLDNATTKAKKLGSSVSDYVKAAADYARLGYSLEEAEILADVSVVYSNVGDNINIEQANEAIISTMKGFGLQAEDAQSIVDKFNEVGNNFAIGTDGIGEALKRSSAALHTANNTLDESIALATAMNTVLQDPEKVGTTLKTVSMFLRASKTDAEAAGEATDGMANSVSELRDDILTLTGQKVDIMLDDGTYKNTYQVLKEISKVWKDIEDVDQANLLELLGGKRNANAVAAVLENFDIAEEALATSQDSVGSALSENEKYLDSIAGKSKQFKASFESLSSEVFPDETIKEFINFGISLVEILENIFKVINALGGLKTALMAVVGIIAVIKAESIATVIKKIISGVKSLATTVKVFTSALIETKSISTSLKAINKSLSTSQMIVLAIIAAIALIRAFSFKKSLEQLQKQASELKKTVDAIDSLNSELDTTTQKINELQQKNSLTFVEKEELTRLRQVNAELESELISLRAIEKFEADKTLKKFRKAEKKYQNKNDYILDHASDERASNFQELVDVRDNSTDKGAYEAYDNYIQEYKDDIVKNYNKGKQMLDALSDISIETLSEADLEAYKRIREEQWAIAKEFTDDFGGLNEVYKMIYGDKMFSNARIVLDSLIETNTLTVDKITKLYDQNKDVKYLIDQLGIDTTKDGWQKGLISWLEKYGIGSKIDPKINDEINDLESLKTELDTLHKSYEAIQNVIKDYNDNGYISIDNFEKLLEVGDEYLTLLIDENGQLNLNTEAYQKLTQAKLEQLTIERIKTMFDNILGMNQDAAAAYACASAYDTESDSLLTLVEAEYKAALMSAYLKDMQLGGTTYVDAIKRSLSSVSMVLQTYASTSDLGNESTKTFTESLQDQQKQLEANCESLEDAKSDIQNFIDMVIDMITQEKELEKEAYEDQKESINELIEQRKELLQTKKDEYEFNKKLAEQQNTVAQNALAASIAELDDSSAGRKAYKEASDNLAASKSDLSSTLLDQEYDVRVDALDERQEFNEKHYDALIDEVDKYLDNERQLYNDACDLIDSDTGQLYDRLWKYTYKYTTTTKGEFDKLWNAAQEGITKYQDSHTPLTSVMSYLDTQINITEKAIEGVSLQIDSVSDSIDNANTPLLNYRDTLSDIIDLIEKLSKLDPDISYTYEYNGTVFVSENDNRDEAAWDIQKQILAYYKKNNKVAPNIPTGAIVGGMTQIKQYASGTLSANGGISLVGENGPELRILNPGDGIMSANITKNLWQLGSDPIGSLAQVAEKLFQKLTNIDLVKANSISNGFNNINKLGNITAPITISISGNANQETVNALKKLAPKIADEAAKKVMEAALQRSSVPRRY